MRSLIIAAALACAALDATASGSASVVCGYNQMPMLVVDYATGADAGTPGLIYLGVLSPDRTSGAVMSEGGWREYRGGLYPFMSRFDYALPPTFTQTLPFPAGSTSTAAFVGYSVYMGHGAYTSQSKAQVADRRASLDKARPSLIASGAWTSEYSSDDRYIVALTQKNMVDKNKNLLILTIPFVDCNPSNAY
jgi:hypothetical protein